MKALIQKFLQKLLGESAKEFDPWMDTMDDDPNQDIMEQVARRVLMKHTGFELRFIKTLTEQIITEYLSITHASPHHRRNDNA